MARGASGVPRRRSLGTRVRSEDVMAAWRGSPRTGRGPPPWERQMTGARGIFPVDVAQIDSGSQTFNAGELLIACFEVFISAQTGGSEGGGLSAAAPEPFRPN